MTEEIYLIIALSVLTILLGVLLYIRVSSEKRRLGVVMRMNLLEFSDFLRTNSVEGNIQSVAGKVSTLLVKTFGCKRIIFLRKKRGKLELNYYHGLNDFNRRDFSLPFRGKLSSKLSKDFLPLKIDGIKTQVPESFYELLRKQKVDVYFPIYWRNNLYGIYFVDESKETRSPAFSLLIASLAHSLSAAYHIKWHESRQSELEKRLESVPNSFQVKPETKQSPQGVPSALFPLVKIKDANELMPRVINALGDEFKFKKFSFAATEQNDAEEIKSYFKGLNEKIDAPGANELKALSNRLKGQKLIAISDIKNVPESTLEWLEKLKKSGLEYLTMFPSSGTGQGILAWSGVGPSEKLKSGLSNYGRLASDLLENAEEFNRAEKMSYTDALTGLANQRYMYKRLEEEINRARRYKRPLAFVIFDIDDLKTVNDTYGHQAGDALIKQVGQGLKKSIRAIDIVARYGGDEFCVVMPESDEATSKKFMKRMLETISGTAIKIDGAKDAIHCSVSMGGALFPGHAKDAEKLIYAADMALLKAKESGRNRFVIHNAPIGVETGG